MKKAKDKKSMGVKRTMSLRVGLRVGERLRVKKKSKNWEQKNGMA